MDSRRERKMRNYSRCKTAIHKEHEIPLSQIFIAPVGLGARGYPRGNSHGPQGSGRVEQVVCA